MMRFVVILLHEPKNSQKLMENAKNNMHDIWAHLVHLRAILFVNNFSAVYYFNFQQQKHWNFHIWKLQLKFYLSRKVRPIVKFFLMHHIKVWNIIFQIISFKFSIIERDDIVSKKPQLFLWKGRRREGDFYRTMNLLYDFHPWLCGVVRRDTHVSLYSVHKWLYCYLFRALGDYIHI